MDEQLKRSATASLDALKGYYEKLLTELNGTETLNGRRVAMFQKRALGEGIQKILANCARALENLKNGDLWIVADTLNYVQSRKHPLFPRIVPNIASECGSIMTYDPSRSESFNAGTTGRLLKTLEFRIRAEIFRKSMRISDDTV